MTPRHRTPTGDEFARLPIDRLWTQREAAYFLGVSTRYLRESDCPRTLLPGNGPRGQPMVRYDPQHIRAWHTQWVVGLGTREATPRTAPQSPRRSA